MADNRKGKIRSKIPLQSVLKDVPLDLMDEILKHKTKPSRAKISFKFRKPVKGVKYGPCGEVKRKDAQSADMYVTFPPEKSWQSQRLSEIATEKYEIGEKLRNAVREHEQEVAILKSKLRTYRNDFSEYKQEIIEEHADELKEMAQMYNDGLKTMSEEFTAQKKNLDDDRIEHLNTIKKQEESISSLKLIIKLMAGEI